MDANDMSIGAVVVNHNAGEALIACVASLTEAGLDLITVVDNDSDDSSLERLEREHPGTRIIRTGQNLGYGTAVNLGARALGVERLFVCNPDLVVDASAPGTLARYLDDHPEVGVVGPRIFEANGEIYPSARAFPEVLDALGHGLLAMFWPGNRFSMRYKSAALSAQGPINTDWVSGACFMARSSAFAEVGGFDESYFMYVEDLDLCWRLRRAGWTAAYVPSASVTHFGGLSTGQRPYRMLVAHHASTWRFARRSLTGAQRLLLPLVAMGIGARLVAATAQQFSRQPRLRAKRGQG